jgi:hypothetical protein
MVPPGTDRQAVMRFRVRGVSGTIVSPKFTVAEATKALGFVGVRR